MPEELPAKPDMENQDIEKLTGEEIEDPFPETWPEDED